MSEDLSRNSSHKFRRPIYRIPGDSRPGGKIAARMRRIQREEAGI